MSSRIGLASVLIAPDSNAGSYPPYSTLIPRLVTAFESTTVRISVPRFTITKCTFTGDSGFPVWSSVSVLPKGHEETLLFLFVKLAL